MRRLGDNIFEIKNLKKHYPVQGGVLRRPVAWVKALDGIDLEVVRGECLGLVGESGCGKTTTGKALVRLHDATGGQILFRPGGDPRRAPVDITRMSSRTLKQMGLRSKLQMVFQDPTLSLNPRMLVKNIIAEPLREQGHAGGRELEERVLALLEMVGLTRDHCFRYPHEFSGGQRQRIAVARAIATHPEFIVLDEPTSALDVSVQAQILNLFQSLQEKLELTYLFVTHHLLAVKYISHRLAVMYLGRIAEIAETETLFAHPRHPYTHALLSGIPVPEMAHRSRRIVLGGDVPSPLNPPSGCRFHTRCPFAIESCREVEPRLEACGENHKTACHRKDEIEGLVRNAFGKRPESPLRSAGGAAAGPRSA